MVIVRASWLVLCMLGFSGTFVQAAAVNGSCAASPTVGGANSTASSSSYTSSTSTWSAPPYVAPTAVPVKKRLTITWEEAAPDGVSRPVIKVNGHMPGPDLIFDEDDYVEITVENKMPFNTTLHWHGMAQQGTPWSDGVPGLTQKPIEPGDSYVYRFIASPSGTYWYHSHSRATLLDGLYGAMYIRPKSESPRPFTMITNNTADLAAMRIAADNPQLIVNSDWDNYTSWDYMQAQEDSNADIFCRDSILVNGHGSVYCPGLDYLISFVPPQLAVTLVPAQINDKGCLPFVYSTEGPYITNVEPQNIPPGLQSGCVPSNGSTYVIDVDAKDGWVSLNFVMAATFMSITFSVDEHDMWLYEADGQFIMPQKIQAITMYPAERYAVLIKLDQKPKDYTMRVASKLSQIMSGFATFRYRNRDRSDTSPTIPWIDYGGFNATPEAIILDGGYTHLPPFPPNPPAQVADAMHVMSLGRWTAPWKWTISGKGILPPDSDAYDPLLYDPYGLPANDPDLVISTKNGTWVDLVLRVGALPGEPAEISHAIHKHGSKAWFIGQGYGIWNYSSVAEGIAAEPQSFNLVDPNYRDMCITTFSGAAWFVLRYQVTNPMPTLLHCHVETHLNGGMGMVIMDGIDRWPSIPPEYAINQNGISHA